MNICTPSAQRAQTLTRLSCAFASGIMTTLAFPGTSITFLIWICLLPLLMAIRETKPSQGFYLGFTTGMAHHLTLLYWIIHTLNTYGKIPLLLCIPILLLLAAYLSLFTGGFAWVISRFFMGRKSLILAAPLLWVSTEYLKSFMFTGFPWEFFGHALHSRETLIQIADLTGVYGLSFLIVTVNVLVFMLIKETSSYRDMTRALRSNAAPVTLCILLLLSAAAYGSFRKGHVEKAISMAPRANISVIQGNIDQSRKWDMAFQHQTTMKYVGLSQLAAEENPDLIIWPETATPFIFKRNKIMTQTVIDGIRSAKSHFIIGSPHMKASSSYSSPDYFNSAYMIRPDGTSSGRYDKVHLVPFGEYVPLKKYLFFIDKLVAQAGNFLQGDAGRTLSWKNTPAGIQICFEILFPDLSRKMVKNGARLLVNLTNDAWFGSTSAPYQHFSMVKFRAVENRRAVARAANTGISGFIDPTGRVTGATEIFQTEVRTRKVPLMEMTTFYTRFGDLFAKAAIALSFLLIAIRLKKEF